MSNAPKTAFVSEAASPASRSSISEDRGAAGVLRCTPPQAAKTYDYLGAFVPFEAGPKQSVSAVLARCCLATHPDFGLDPAPVAEEASTLARSALNHPDRARLDLDPLLLATCYAMLADEGLDVAPLRDLLAEVARALGALDPTVRRVGRVRHVAWLLAASGFAVTVEPAASEVLELSSDPSRILNIPAETLTDLSHHLFIGSGLDSGLSVMLALTALGELRNYRVDLGAKLLRLVIARGRFCTEAEEGLNFVALQRRRNGAYGFVNPFLPPSEGQSLDNDFFLPMTLNAAWLLRTEAANRKRWRGTDSAGGS